MKKILIASALLLPVTFLVFRNKTPSNSEVKDCVLASDKRRSDITDLEVSDLQLISANKLDNKGKNDYEANYSYIIKAKVKSEGYYTPEGNLITQGSLENYGYFKKNAEYFLSSHAIGCFVNYTDGTKEFKTGHFNCEGLPTMEYTPEVYKNELANYARHMGEVATNKKWLKLTAGTLLYLPAGKVRMYLHHESSDWNCPNR